MDKFASRKFILAVLGIVVAAISPKLVELSARDMMIFICVLLALYGVFNLIDKTTKSV